jgi:hypothetical protein
MTAERARTRTYLVRFRGRHANRSSTKEDYFFRFELRLFFRAPPDRGFFGGGTV